MPSKERMPSIDWAPEALLVIGRDGVVLDANPAAAALFGYHRDELRSRAVEVVLPGFPPHGAGEASETLRAIGVRSARATARRRDGSRFAARLNWLTVPEELGEHLVASIHEAEMGRSASSGEDLASLRQQLDFFSLFNHDVRQSLQSIQFLCDSILDRVPETASTISEIVGSVKTLLDTVVRLGDARPGVADLRPCLLGDVLRALGRELQPIAQRKGLALVIDDSPDRIRTDPVLLRELLQNLMANAVRYTPSGSVHVQCSSGGASSVRIEIVDTGVGIDGERLCSLIAAPGAAAGLLPGRGSSGFGLAIARRLSDALGCRIEASSKPGEGSRFTVVVPRSGGRRDPLRVGGAASGASAHR